MYISQFSECIGYDAFSLLVLLEIICVAQNVQARQEWTRKLLLSPERIVASDSKRLKIWYSEVCHICYSFQLLYSEFLPLADNDIHACSCLW